MDDNKNNKNIILYYCDFNSEMVMMMMMMDIYYLSIHLRYEYWISIIYSSLINLSDGFDTYCSLRFVAEEIIPHIVRFEVIRIIGSSPYDYFIVSVLAVVARIVRLGYG